jgi:hypothetical protein
VGRTLYSTRLFTTLIGSLACVLLAGCVSVTRTLPDGSTERLRGDAIRDYATEVFKRHNAASSMLLQALPFIEDVDVDAADALLDAESTMNAQCAPIDALAIAYRDGQPVDLGDRLAFARALDACETSTRALEDRLTEIQGAP